MSKRKNRSSRTSLVQALRPSADAAPRTALPRLLADVATATQVTATAAPAVAAEARELHQLHGPVPLSESSLWTLLEEYYLAATLDTWNPSEGAVPCYITSNAVIGDVYAELICATILDQIATLDPAEPIHVIELAAGAGMFGFHVLRALSARIERSSVLRTLKIRYVMTDFTANNVSGWDRVTSFAPFRASGLLDSAVYWPEKDRSLSLRASGTTLTPDTGVNGAIVIANYFFDSLRADAFRVMDGKLHELRYSAFEDRSLADNAKRPFSRISTTVTCVPTRLDYYEKEHLNAILGEYLAQPGSATVTFPTGAFEVLDNLRALFPKGVALISSDKGFTDLEYVKHSVKPDFAEHGSISFTVNYDAIARYFRQLGGTGEPLDPGWRAAGRR
jgi:hypothetical protein